MNGINSTTVFGLVALTAAVYGITGLACSAGWLIRRRAAHRAVTRYHFRAQPPAIEVEIQRAVRDIVQYVADAAAGIERTDER